MRKQISLEPSEVLNEHLRNWGKGWLADLQRLAPSKNRYI